jgi:hypothetical protein
MRASEGGMPAPLRDAVAEGLWRLPKSRLPKLPHIPTRTVNYGLRASNACEFTNASHQIRTQQIALETKFALQTLSKARRALPLPLN